MNKVVLRKIVSYAFILVVFYFLVSILISNWAQIKTHNFQLDVGLLLISFVLFFLSTLVGNWVLMYLFKNSGHTIAFGRLYRIFVFSQLAKYTPGTIWTYLVRFRELRNQVTKEAFVSVSIFENVVNIFSGIMLTMVLFSQEFFDERLKIIAWIIAVGLFILIIMPGISFRLIDIMLRIFRRDPVVWLKNISAKVLLIAVFASFINWFLKGLGFFLVAVSILETVSAGPVIFIAVFAASVVSGYIIAVSPGGLGVREGVMVLGLQNALGIELATMFGFVARIWTVLSDVLIALFVFIFSKLKKDA